MIFCDTSFFAKLYLPERESASVQERFDREDQICLSELARVELAAALHRTWREKYWTRSQYQAALAQFAQDDLSNYWTWLPIGEEIVRGAARLYERLPEDVPLRSADCLHLATALHHRFEEIHTFDKHQAAAAAALGLRTINA